MVYHHFKFQAPIIIISEQMKMVILNVNKPPISTDRKWILRKAFEATLGILDLYNTFQRQVFDMISHQELMY